MPTSTTLFELVEHADALDARTLLSAAQPEFARRKRRFLGVVDGARLVGIASGREITERLSAQFGHALFGRQTMAQHVMAEALIVERATLVPEVLRLIAARSEEAFYDDIALVDDAGAFVGMVPVHRLVRLQNAMLLENLAQVEEQRGELAVRNRRIEDDLRMARQVQLALLPGRVTRISYGAFAAEARYRYEAAETMSGDFCAVSSPCPGELACLVCDVMGHGVRQALITAILRALLEELRPLASDPGALLTQVNRSLTTLLQRAGELIFVTAGYGVVDLVRGEMRYAQAGHPAPLVLRAGAATAEPLALDGDQAGPALGLLAEMAYETARVPFGAGDALLLFTDGVQEAADGAGVEFGAAGLAEALATAGNEVDPTGPVVEAARRHGGRFADDVCVVAVRCWEK